MSTFNVTSASIINFFDDSFFELLRWGWVEGCLLWISLDVWTGRDLAFLSFVFITGACSGRWFRLSDSTNDFADFFAFLSNSFFVLTSFNRFLCCNSSTLFLSSLSSEATLTFTIKSSFSDCKIFGSGSLSSGLLWLLDSLSVRGLLTMSDSPDPFSVTRAAMNKKTKSRYCSRYYEPFLYINLYLNWNLRKLVVIDSFIWFINHLLFS